MKGCRGSVRCGEISRFHVPSCVGERTYFRRDRGAAWTSTVTVASAYLRLGIALLAGALGSMASHGWGTLQHSIFGGGTYSSRRYCCWSAQVDIICGSGTGNPAAEASSLSTEDPAEGPKDSSSNSVAATGQSRGPVPVASGSLWVAAVSGSGRVSHHSRSCVLCAFGTHAVCSSTMACKL